MKSNMVYMVIGIGVRMAMWNASFSKAAKQNSMGEMYGSSQALGFAIKEQLNRDGYNVLYRKRINESGVMDLKDSFEYLSGATVKECKSENDVKRILFKEFTDIIHFGTVFAAKSYPSFGICGAVQIGVGQNKFADTEQIVNEMLPCFSAENGKKAQKADSEDTKLKSNTLGEQYLLDRAHFVYDITLNPYQYEDLVRVIDGFDGYTEQHYQDFKEASMKAVSNLNTKSKKGCTNEFAMYVETKDSIRDSIDLNCLSEYIRVDEQDGKTIYDLTQLGSLLKEVEDSIKSIEVYYDNRLMQLVGDIDGAKYYNIRTRKGLS